MVSRIGAFATAGLWPRLCRVSPDVSTEKVQMSFSIRSRIRTSASDETGAPRVSEIRPFNPLTGGAGVINARLATGGFDLDGDIGAQKSDQGNLRARLSSWARCTAGKLPIRTKTLLAPRRHSGLPARPRTKGPSNLRRRARSWRLANPLLGSFRAVGGLRARAWPPEKSQIRSSVPFAVLTPEDGWARHAICRSKNETIQRKVKINRYFSR